MGDRRRSLCLPSQVPLSCLLLWAFFSLIGLVKSLDTTEPTIHYSIGSTAASLSSNNGDPSLADPEYLTDHNDNFNADTLPVNLLSEFHVPRPDTVQIISLDTITTASTSIIDILSSSAHFSTLLRYIRIFGLVPDLNFPEGEGITLIAPLNSAFAKAEINRVEITKELLLYHIVSTPVTHSDFNNTSTELITSTWYNFSPLLITGSNCNETACDDLKAGDVTLESENSTAKTTAKGVIQVTDNLLEIPRGLCEILSELENATLFSSLVLLNKKQYCDETSEDFLTEITLLVPLDSAFKNEITDTELKYLSSSWGREDRTKLLLRHTIPSILGSSSVINDHLEVKTSDNSTLNFSSDMTINGTLAANEKNLLFRQGIIHTYNSFAIDPEDVTNFFGFDIRKYLYGVGAASFLREVEFRGLSKLLDNSEVKQTIFVPTILEDSLDEEYLSISDLPESSKLDGEGQDLSTLSSKFYSYNKASTLYHFAEGEYDFDSLIPDVGSSVLLNSRMTSKRLSGFHQKIKITRASTGKLIINNHDFIISTEEIKIGNCRMYLMHDNIYLPRSLSESVGPIFRSSRSMSYLNDLDLLTFPGGSAYTVFLPTISGWDDLGLVTDYLEANQTALRIVFENIIVDIPFYTNDEKMEDVKLLNGDKISIEYDDDRFILVGRSKDADEDLTVVLPTQSDLMVDILFDAGVAHPVANVPLPHTLKINSRDLLEVAGAGLFIELLDSFNLSHVLEPNSGYSILAPSARGLALANISADTPDIEMLLKLHILPDNPLDSLLSSKEGQIRTLIDNVHLQSREISEGVFLIQIVEGNDHDVRVLNKGLVNPPFVGSIEGSDENANSSMIVVIDKPLLPSWITPPSPPGLIPPLHDHLKTPIAIGLGIVLGVVVISFVLSFCFCVFIGTDPGADLKRHKRHSSAVLPVIDEESGVGTFNSTDATPLLQDRERQGITSLRTSRSQRSINCTSSGDASRGPIPEIHIDNEYIFAADDEDGRINKSAESAHSEHSVSQPIKTTSVQADRKPRKFGF